MYIKISVNNKIATLQDNVLIINGNSDYVIKFDFDAEWDAYETKTARFVTARGYTDVVFSGDEVALPVIIDAISVRVGVYAGNLHTTTPAVIFCRRCITDGSGSPVEPTPDVYAQIMERLNNLDGATPATTEKLGVVKIGDNLKITKDGVLSVDTAEAVEQDNTKPVTSAAVYTAKSNIGALLGNLNDLTTEAKNNLVAAINEAARTGGGGGGASIELDTTLTQSGKAADAKAVGDALAGKQNTISDLEAIRTGAAKGATALQSVPSTYRTASEQDTIDDGKVDKVMGKGLSSNDYTDAAKAKVDALAPVATSGSYNDLTNKPTIPTALPNPNALTFTGAVTGSYDGSEALTVEIPSGGGGGVDMGITGATVGQIAKIAAVDESGVPTAWSPVDMPSGGGDETPIDTISEGTLSEDVANIVIDGFSKRAIALVTVPYGSTANSGTIKISLKFGLDSGDVLTLTPNYNFVTNTAAVSWNKIVVFASVDNGIFDATIYRDGASISGDIYINNSIATNVWVAKSIYIGAKKITSVTIGLQADGVIGKNTVYKVVGA